MALLSASTRIHLPHHQADPLPALPVRARARRGAFTIEGTLWRRTKLHRVGLAPRVHAFPPDTRHQQRVPVRYGAHHPQAIPGHHHCDAHSARKLKPGRSADHLRPRRIEQGDPYRHVPGWNSRKLRDPHSLDVVLLRRRYRFRLELSSHAIRSAPSHHQRLDPKNSSPGTMSVRSSIASSVGGGGVTTHAATSGNTTPAKSPRRSTPHIWMF